MTRNDVVKNLMSTYGKHGVTELLIEDEIESGLKHGFSYQTIYTGLRMALGNAFNVREYFTPAEMAEAFGATEEEMIAQVEDLRQQLIDAGEDPNEYFTKVEPEQTQRFVVLPGGLK